MNYDPDAIISDDGCRYSDIDGNIYHSIRIGSQLWLKSNLKTTCYRSGDPIQTGFSGNDWCDLDESETGAYTFFPTNPGDWNQQMTCAGDCAEVYGNLYNWYAVDDDRGVCPEGFHVPSDEEWMELEMALGMSAEDAWLDWFRGTNEGSKLAGQPIFWRDGEPQNDEEFGESGFMALPGGWYNCSYYCDYDGMENYTGFWSSTEYINDNVQIRCLDFQYSEIFRGAAEKISGLSVRCLRDDEP